MSLELHISGNLKKGAWKIESVGGRAQSSKNLMILSFYDKSGQRLLRAASGCYGLLEAAVGAV